MQVTHWFQSGLRQSVELSPRPSFVYGNCFVIVCPSLEEVGLEIVDLAPDAETSPWCCNGKPRMGFSSYKIEPVLFRTPWFQSGL